MEGTFDERDCAWRYGGSEVRFGKPVIKGTRVPVDLVIGKLAGGLSVEQVMEEYFLQKRRCSKCSCICRNPDE